MLRLKPVDGSAIITPYSSFESEVLGVYPISGPNISESSLSLIAFTADGRMYGFNRRGNEIGQWDWPYQLPSQPSVILPSTTGYAGSFQENLTTFLVSSDSGRLEQLSLINNQPVVTWGIEDLGVIQALSWEDQNLDGLPDTGFFGSRDGSVYLYEQLQTRNPQRILDLSLTSRIFELSFLKRTSRQSSDLLAVTQNGMIRLYREGENRPPLLTNPQVEADRGQYSIGIWVSDVDAVLPGGRGRRAPQPGI